MELGLPTLVSYPPSWGMSLHGHAVYLHPKTKLASIDKISRERV